MMMLCLQIFDPVGLSDVAAPDEIKKWCEAKIKHGLVVMLVSLGVLVAEGIINAMPLYFPRCCRTSSRASDLLGD